MRLIRPIPGRRWGGLGIVLCLGAGTSQAQATRFAVDFPLRLIDLTVIPDTAQGLHVLVQPSVQAKPAKDGGLVWLRFDPDTVLDWINGAAGALVASVPNGPADGIQWSRTLRPIWGQGGIALGRSLKKGRLEKTRWLAVGDSAVGWKNEITGTEADSLLRLLMTLGMQSRLDTTRPPAAPLDYRDVDVPVTVVSQPQPRFRGKTGRVVTAYVVDENGKADPSTFEAFVVSDPGLIAEAWEVLKASRYTPAMLAGKPVRQLVRQVIQWNPYRPPETP